MKGFMVSNKSRLRLQVKIKRQFMIHEGFHKLHVV